MAFFDDPKLLTAHLRHSFITSDDTGMCELIMINEDLDKEIKTDHKFYKRSLRLAQRYNPSEHLPRYARSYDIYASPSMPRRPPLKNDANMFELMEKKRSKSSQVKSVVWNNENLAAFDPEQFTRREVARKPRDAGPSYLSVMLAEHSKLSSNPFFDYSKFNGENHGMAVTNTYHIFLSMSKTPLRPITVTVLHQATVADLVGLTLWKYVEQTPKPVKLRAVKNYSVRIAEEDGDIDTDLPALQKEDRIAKFRFKHLGIVEVKKKTKIVEGASPRPVVKVYYEQGGFSTLAISDYSIDMGEILGRVIRKRCLEIHGYELERKDSPGVAIDLNSTLEHQKTLDYVLVKNKGRAGTFSSLDKEEDSDLPDVKDELTFYQYKSYNITMVNKHRSNSEVILGVSGDRIEVEPVGHSRSFFPRASKSQKPMTYEVKKICACELLDDKNAAKRAFRIIRLAKDGSYKNLDFEAPQGMTKEIVRKLNLILDGVSGGARSEFL